MSFKTMATTRAVTISPARSGRRMNIMGTDVEVKLTGADTGGALSMFDVHAVPGDGIPMHTHSREDEIFHILEGQLRVISDGVEHIATAGTTVFLPRGLAHEWWVHGKEPARIMLITTPGTFDSFFAELATPPGEAPRPNSEVLHICRRFGIDFA